MSIPLVIIHNFKSKNSMFVYSIEWLLRQEGGIKLFANLYLKIYFFCNTTYEIRIHYFCRKLIMHLTKSLTDTSFLTFACGLKYFRMIDSKAKPEHL